MPEHQQTQQPKMTDNTSQKQTIPPKHIPTSHPAAIIQRARINPKSLTHADVMQLQRTIGNRAVGKLLTEIGLISSKAKQAPPVQMEPILEENEEPLQGKIAETIQHQDIPEEEEEPLQGKILGTTQRQEIPEEEELLQGEFENEPKQATCPSYSTFPIQREKENRTGMPDDLKIGVENLSGIDMSNVRVLYNSPKPAKVGALAYTQGTNIHVAPGQEKYLPHEAWHVVQQVQGRVRPTFQKKGMTVNDDIELEREADVMGYNAFKFTNNCQMKNNEEATGDSSHVNQFNVFQGVIDKQQVLQMKEPIWKDDNHPDSFLDNFVNKLCNLVENAATLALDPSDLPEIDGRISLWKDTAIILKKIDENDINGEDSDEVAEANAAKSFAAARYGYAVESLACNNIDILKAALPAGCEFQLQASRGMTRPDIVVQHHTDGEIAWLDITSEDSVGHIDKKTGSGWKTKKYVAEIIYSPLDKNKIGTGKLSIGEKVAKKNAMKRRIKAWNDIKTGFLRNFDNQWEEAEGAKIGDKRKKAAKTKEIIGSILEFDVTPEQTKSILRAISVSIKDYGFDKGGTKSEGETILRNMYGA